MVETQFQTSIVFLMKDDYSFRRISCNRELILDCWRSYRESTFANIVLKLVLGTKKTWNYVKLSKFVLSNTCHFLSIIYIYIISYS